MGKELLTHLDLYTDQTEQQDKVEEPGEADGLVGVNPGEEVQLSSNEVRKTNIFTQW